MALSQFMERGAMVDWKEVLFPKAEVLFPPRLIPKLRNLRESPDWRALVDRVTPLPDDHPDKLAFCLMMIRIDNCLNCFNGSYKFMRGCEVCATQNIAQFKQEDEDLLRLYEVAREDIRAALEEGKPLPDRQEKIEINPGEWPEGADE